MHEPVDVRGIQRRGDLPEDRHRPRWVERAVPAKLGAQIASLHQLHRQIQLALVLAGVVDPDHVRVVDCCGHPRLADEARAKAGILRVLRRDHLHRDLALEHEVPRPVDHCPSPRARQSLDPTACDQGARCELQHRRTPNRCRAMVMSSTPQ
jgi:hypothetical protein